VSQRTVPEMISIALPRLQVAQDFVAEGDQQEMEADCAARTGEEGMDIDANVQGNDLGDIMLDDDELLELAAQTAEEGTDGFAAPQHAPAAGAQHDTTAEDEELLALLEADDAFEAHAAELQEAGAGHAIDDEELIAMALADDFDT
jgi:hypothetical protein